jgi:hypothetical protein
MRSHSVSSVCWQAAVTPPLNITSRSCTISATACRKTLRKGEMVPPGPPTKATRVPKPISGPCTRTAKACRKISPKQRNGFALAADRGYGRAQTYLGSLHAHGQGVPHDIVEALRWYCKAAYRGDALGQYYLGLMYFEGLGVPQSFLLAHKWMNLAAARFSPAENDQRIKAIEKRELLASRMTSAQIAKAQHLSRQWAPK